MAYYLMLSKFFVQGLDLLAFPEPLKYGGTQNFICAILRPHIVVF